MPGPDSAAFIRANTAVASPPLVPEIKLHLASEVTPLWQATEAALVQQRLPPPYWAFAWPGGQALARLVLDEPARVRGRRVWDLGAGGGLAAIAAAAAGAKRVIAVEIDPLAAAAIGLNAALNRMTVAVEVGDILDPNPDFPGGSGDVNDLILVGDMCYERPLADRLLARLRDAAGRGAEVLLGDPGRAYLPKAGLERVASYTVPTSLDLEDRTARDTVVYCLRD